jgi:hypothetical protein
LQLGGVNNGRGEGILWLEERDNRGLPVEQLRFKSKGRNFAMVVGNAVIDEGTKSNAEVFVVYVVTAVS